MRACARTHNFDCVGACTRPYDVRQQQLMGSKKPIMAKKPRSGGDDMFVSAPTKSAAQLKAEAEAKRKVDTLPCKAKTHTAYA